MLNLIADYFLGTFFLLMPVVIVVLGVLDFIDAHKGNAE